MNAPADPGKLRPLPSSGAPKASRLWWAVHQWVGLKLTLFMSFVLLTGTLAVFSYEIDWLIDPKIRVERAASETPVNWPAIATNLAAALPDAEVISLEAPVDTGFAASAFITLSGDQTARAYFHPSTGAYQGISPWYNAQTILRRLHRHLFLPTKIGIPIVSSLSILLAISLATSFVVYKKWWRGFFKPIRWRDARTAWGDFHRLAGLWSLWFVTLMIVTGFWYLVETLGGDAPAHPKTKVEPVALAPTVLADQFGAALRSAETANPELKIQRVMYPTAGSGAFQFQGQHVAILVRERSNAVWADAQTSEVKLVTDARDLNVHQRISEAADPLHFGYFGGVWTKIIWFAFGAGLTALSISGAAIYSFRLMKAERRASSVPALISISLKFGAGWTWVGAGLILTAFVVMALAIWSL